MRLLPYTLNKRKIALQARHYFIEKPVMPEGWQQRYDAVMEEYKPISAAFNQQICRCDEARRVHEEKHGDRYPYFQCECGQWERHAELVEVVAKINKMQLELGLAQTVGVRAHIHHGERAWFAKSKWMKRTL